MTDNGEMSTRTDFTRLLLVLHHSVNNHTTIIQLAGCLKTTSLLYCQGLGRTLNSPYRRASEEIPISGDTTKLS